MSEPLTVWIDGHRFEPQDAKISVFDRGFLYGDAVFEVLRTYNQAPFALGEHIDRLFDSLRAVLIDSPVSKEDIAREIVEACRSFDHDVYVRIMITRGIGAFGLDPSTATTPTRVVVVGKVQEVSPDKYREGVSLVTVRSDRVVEGTQASRAKVSNYLPNLLALAEAKTRGGDEALLVASNGNVTEGATSNVFIVRDGHIVTPPDDGSILPGITRAHVIRVAQEYGYNVTFCNLRENDLYSADEVFITSSIREVIGASHVNGRPIGSGVAGPIATSLRSAFLHSNRLNLDVGAFR